MSIETTRRDGAPQMSRTNIGDGEVAVGGSHLTAVDAGPEALVLRRRLWLSAIGRWLEPALVVILLLSLWEILSRVGVISPFAAPAPSVIAVKLYGDVQSQDLWQSVWISVKAWAVGLGIVIAIGIPVGTLLGVSRPAYKVTYLSVEFVRTIPSVAALPFLVLLYGLGFKLTVILVVLTAIWPLLIQTMYGAQDVDPVATDTARVFGLGRVRRFIRVVLPSAAPYIGTGLRLAGVLGMIIAIATSLLVGGPGLGSAIADAERAGQLALMYARIFITGLLGLAVTLLLMRIERHFLRWHPSMREAQQ